MNTLHAVHPKFIRSFERVAHSDVFLNQVIPYILVLFMIGILIKVAIH